jgi:3-oxoacyl-[acyl-carrier protein] reductase
LWFEVRYYVLPAEANSWLYIRMTIKRVAVVTGAAHGIGRAIAESLRSVGHTVHGVDREQVDLSKSVEVAKYFAEVGPVDILVNCAGGVVGQVHHPLEEISDADWQAVLDANIQTTFFCTRAVVSHMKNISWGRIVNISSGAGRSISLTGIQAYSTAKAAQIAFTRQMAYELGQFGITVNCVAPGFVLSNPTTIKQWESYGAEGQEKLVAGIATRRLGKAEDIANGVAFFVQESSDWVTGQCLSIDGGHSLF